MIHLRGVSKQFEGKSKVTALERLDLDIARGEMVSIVGPSGSGKSTLLNLIGGLDRPTENSPSIHLNAGANRDSNDVPPPGGWHAGSQMTTADWFGLLAQVRHG